jgi:nucleotide-binding universal stress UspA family protein
VAIKIILAPMSGAESAEATFANALHVGRHLGAHVEAFHVSLDPRDSVAYMAEGMTSNMIQDIMSAVEKEGEERRERAHEQFSRLCQEAGAPITEGLSGAGYSASFATAVGREDDLLAVRGRLSDLIVAARSGGKGDTQRTTLEIALLETGRPVLLAPPNGAKGFGKTVSIAWNGSVEVVRAIGAGAGLHFLGEAEKVVIMVVPEAFRSTTHVDDLVNYLGCHDIQAEVAQIDDSGRPIGHVLLEKSKEVGADMMVMGAYTHSRLRHMMIGGPTSVVLQNAEIPVLMAH